jgi:orotate phosphoribosyltransferase
MREVADSVSTVAAALPTEWVSTYLQVLTLATANGLLDPTVHKLSVDAIVNQWTNDDPRWDLLTMAA